MPILRWVLLPLTAALGACNMAVSDKPMFAEVQRSSTLALEDGLWVNIKSECNVDFAMPKDQWDECADWFVVKANRIIADSDHKPEQPFSDIFIIDGAPPLLQLRLSNNDPENPAYGYLVLKPIGRSAGGGITELEVWPVACGTEEDDGTIGGKVRPYPGFSVKCEPNSVELLRATAEKSLPPEKDMDELRWKWVRAENP